MYEYDKDIKTTEELLRNWSNKGMKIGEPNEAKEIIENIGYYRLKGYCSHLRDKDTGVFKCGTDFEKIVSLYDFDSKLSNLIFDFIMKIEVSLRARLASALLLHEDSFILNNPSIFSGKSEYWQNQSSIANEISRSKDAFIKHHFEKYEGVIPIWAVVEVMTFGTLSKVIKNLKPKDKAAKYLAENYKYKKDSGNSVKPSHDMLSSWVYSVSTLRNICAHNSRIYNRIISITPQIIDPDKISPDLNNNYLYKVLLAMKYLRPTDKSWRCFYNGLESLLNDYTDVVDLERLSFPPDWKNHLSI